MSTLASSLVVSKQMVEDAPMLENVKRGMRHRLLFQHDVDEADVTGTAYTVLEQNEAGIALFRDELRKRGLSEAGADNLRLIVCVVTVDAE